MIIKYGLKSTRKVKCNYYKKIFIFTVLLCMLFIIPVAAADDIMPLADITYKSSYRESSTGVRLTFYSSGNYTSSGVTVGGLSTTQTDDNWFNYFDNIKMTKRSGKTNPYAKCTFKYVHAGSYVASTASVVQPLIHNY